MTENTIIQVIDSWELASFGIIVELKHLFNGIRSGTLIKSQSTGNEWRINKRIIYCHTYGKQKLFSNETTALSLMSFDNLEKQIASANTKLNKEENYIFHYQLQPIGHKSKPLKNEILVETVIHNFACPCCGYKTFREKPNGTYDICEVCYWEDDPIQLNDPNYEGGANRVSLKQGQKNFIEFGACEREMIKNVRQSTIFEQRDENWKPLE